MNRLAGLMLALILSGCTNQQNQPTHYIFSRDTTLVVMEPITIASGKNSHARFRDVDGHCQYSGKIDTDGHGVWWADIDNEFCFPDAKNPGIRSISAIISMGILKENVAQNTMLNVRFSQL